VNYFEVLVKFDSKPSLFLLRVVDWFKCVLIQLMHSNPWGRHGAMFHPAGASQTIHVGSAGMASLAKVRGWLNCECCSSSNSNVIVVIMGILAYCLNRILNQNLFWCSLCRGLSGMNVKGKIESDIVELSELRSLWVWLFLFHTSIMFAVNYQLSNITNLMSNYKNMHKTCFIFAVSVILFSSILIRDGILFFLSFFFLFFVKKGDYNPKRTTKQ